MIVTKQISLSVFIHVLAKFHYSQWTSHDWSNKCCDMWKDDEPNLNSLEWNLFSIQGMSLVQKGMLIITVKTMMDHFID
jgi:hypothetical protein